MGNYTAIGMVRSATGFTTQNTPSGTVNFCIKRGEAALKKYLGITPVTGSLTEIWVQDAATSFAAHYLSLRLASQDIANQVYQGQARREGGATFTGHSIGVAMWWEEAVRICDMHGRKVEIIRIEPN